jgi:hypothetical protein
VLGGFCTKDLRPEMRKNSLTWLCVLIAIVLSTFALLSSIPQAAASLQTPGGISVAIFGTSTVNWGWSLNPQASGYRLIRVAPGGSLRVSFAPPQAHDSFDGVAEPIACYQADPVDALGNPINADSRPGCVAPRIATGAGPTNIRVSPGATSSRIGWLGGTAVSPATDYVFVPIGTTRIQVVPSTTVSVVDPHGGTPTCYVVFARNGEVVIGNSHVVCGLPNRFI